MNLKLGHFLHIWGKALNSKQDPLIKSSSHPRCHENLCQTHSWHSCVAPVDFPAAQARSPDSHTNWGILLCERDCRRSELTGLPLGLHIKFMQQSGEGAPSLEVFTFLRLWIPVSSSGYCPCTEAASLCQIPSPVDAVNNFCKEDWERATI